MAWRSLLPLVLSLMVLLTDGESPYYEVPEPLIEAVSPRGLRISVPDEPGVELFAVHANVNKPMRNLEAGQISRDITKATNGRWVFEDKRVRLKTGDVINYWLYVQADGLGYRRDDQTYIVTNLVPGDTPESEHGKPTNKPPTRPPRPPSGSMGPTGPPGHPGLPLGTEIPIAAQEIPLQTEHSTASLHSEDKVYLHTDYQPSGGPQMIPPPMFGDMDLIQQEREQSRMRHELLVHQATELHELKMAHEQAEHRERLRLLRDGCKIDDEDPPEMRVWRYRRDYWP